GWFGRSTCMGSCPRMAEARLGSRVQAEFLSLYRIHAGSICCAKVRETLKRVRWVRNCMVRRRRGEEEISWEEFDEIQLNRPWFVGLYAERTLNASKLNTFCCDGFAGGRS